MPRQTHKFPKPKPESETAYEQLRCLHLAVKLRSEQVKLRRLEWDTQELALPHIWPLPGDSELQVRTPLTPADMPRPRPPVKRPDFVPGMPSDLMKPLLELYMSELRDEHDRNPYNKRASKSEQAKMEAKQEREDARRDR
jgi:hypothetical protein